MTLCFYFWDGRSEILLARGSQFAPYFLCNKLRTPGPAWLCISHCSIESPTGQTLSGHHVTDVKNSHFYPGNPVVALINRGTISTLFIWGKLESTSSVRDVQMEIRCCFFCPESKQLSAPSNVCFSFSFKFFGTKRPAGIPSISIIFSRFRGSQTHNYHKSRGQCVTDKSTRAAD